MEYVAITVLGLVVGGAFGWLYSILTTTKED